MSFACYNVLADNLWYRALLGSGRPLTHEDFSAIEKNAELFCTLKVLGNKVFLKYFGDRV